jgi:hypothetical protein
LPIRLKQIIILGLWLRKAMSVSRNSNSSMSNFSFRQLSLFASLIFYSCQNSAGSFRNAAILKHYYLVFNTHLPNGDKCDTISFYNNDDSSAYLYGIIQKARYETSYNFQILDSGYDKLSRHLSARTLRDIDKEAAPTFQSIERSKRANGVIQLIDTSQHPGE